MIQLETKENGVSGIGQFCMFPFKSEEFYNYQSEWFYKYQFLKFFLYISVLHIINFQWVLLFLVGPTMEEQIEMERGSQQKRHISDNSVSGMNRWNSKQQDRNVGRLQNQNQSGYMMRVESSNVPMSSNQNYSQSTRSGSFECKVHKNNIFLK